MMSNKISIVLPVYNCENTIRRCLDSIMVQTYDNFELIIVDDGSTDSTFEIIKSLYVKDKRVTLLQQARKGVSSARNYALTVVSGEYIMFVDGDDYVSKNWCEELLTCITQKNVDLVVGNYCSLTLNGEINNRSLPEKKFLKRRYFSKLCKAPGRHYYGVLWNKIFKTEIIKKNNISFMNKNFGEDFIFNLEYLKFINKIYITKKIIYFYEENNKTSLSKNVRDIYQQADERICLYKAYYSAYKQINKLFLGEYKVHKYAMNFFRQLSQQNDYMQFDYKGNYVSDESKKQIREYLQREYLDDNNISQQEYNRYIAEYTRGYYYRKLKIDIKTLGIGNGISNWIEHLVMQLKSIFIYNILIYCNDCDKERIDRDVAYVKKILKKVKIRMVSSHELEVKLKKHNGWKYNLIIFINCNSNKVKDLNLNSNVLIYEQDYDIEKNKSFVKTKNKFYEKKDVIILDNKEKVQYINKNKLAYRERAYYISNLDIESDKLLSLIQFMLK